MQTLDHWTGDTRPRTRIAVQRELRERRQQRHNGDVSIMADLIVAQIEPLEQRQVQRRAQEADLVVRGRGRGKGLGGLG